MDTVNLFLRSTCCIFAIAFASLFVQYPGLFGCDGLVPLLSQPGHFLHSHPLSIIGAEALCILGAVLSLAGTAGFSTVPILLIISLLYASFVGVGYPFLSFQWDILLIETGFTAALLAPLLRPRSHFTNPAALWALRFLLFKLMLMSGVVKLQADCPTWLGLTALHYHYASQCIPTPLAWYAALLPDFVQKLSVAATLAIEIPLTVLILFPHSAVRRIGALLQLQLQVLIALTGNYTFFNLLTAALCLPLLQQDRDVLPAGRRWMWRLWNVVAVLFSLSALVMSAAMFRIKVSALSTTLVGFDVQLVVSFEQVQLLLERVLPVVGLAVCIFCLLSGLLFAVKQWSYQRRLLTLYAVVITGISAAAVAVNCVTLIDNLSPRASSQVPLQLKQLHSHTGAWHIGSGYGLFRRMTGVGQTLDNVLQVARPEIVLQGSMDGMQWTDIEFRYKPTNVSRSPPWVAPHQPRLDWQMWFAALSSYQQQPWFITLVYKLLHGSSDVIDLLDRDRYPFLEQPPKLIRADLYTYNFTTSWNGSQWWRRVHKHEYFPALAADNPSLRAAVVQLGVDPDVKSPQCHSSSALQTMMYRTRQHFMAVVVAVVVLLMTVVWWQRDPQTISVHSTATS